MLAESTSTATELYIQEIRIAIIRGFSRCGLRSKFAAQTDTRTVPVASTTAVVICTTNYKKRRRVTEWTQEKVVQRGDERVGTPEKPWKGALTGANSARTTALSDCTSYEY